MHISSNNANKQVNASTNNCVIRMCTCDTKCKSKISKKQCNTLLPIFQSKQTLFDEKYKSQSHHTYVWCVTNIYISTPGTFYHSYSRVFLKYIYLRMVAVLLILLMLLFKRLWDWDMAVPLPNCKYSTTSHNIFYNFKHICFLSIFFIRLWTPRHARHTSKKRKTRGGNFTHVGEQV